MQPSTGNSTPKPISLVFRDWVLVIPLIAACVGVAGFVLICWLGDGTLTSLYRIEYFLPLPLYCVVAFIWIFLPAVILGFVIAGVTFIRRHFSQ